MADEINRRLDNLEAEEVEEAGLDYIINCVCVDTQIGPDGEKHEVQLTPVGWDEGEWHPHGKGRIRTRWARYADHNLLRPCDREALGLAPDADHGGSS